MFLPFIGFGQCVSGDCQNGYGVFTSEEGTYKGYWKDGKVHGNGVFKGSDYTYNGEYVNGKKHGQGEIKYTNGIVVKGTFKNGKFVKAKSGCISGNCGTGKGIFVYADGSKYEGDFRYNIKHGKGKFTSSSGVIQEGVWRNDKFIGEKEVLRTGCIYGNCKNGNGIYQWGNGDKYEGKWKNNLKDGQGIMTTKTIVYEGEFKNDLFHGFGTLIWNHGRWKGDKYVGEFKNGVKHGNGISTYAKTGKSVKGKWKNGEQIIK